MDLNQRAALRWGQYQRENRREMDKTDSLHQEPKLSRLSSAPTQTLSIAMIFEAARWAKNLNSPLCVEGQWRGLIEERTLLYAIEHTNECLKAADFLDAIANKEVIAREAEILFAHVGSDFRRVDDFIFLTRTDLTRRYCRNSGRAGSWKPDDLYLRFILHLQRRGEACLS